MHGLRGVRARHLAKHHGEADFVRGVFRRISRNAAAGAENQGWAKNVYVKIPITNTRGESSLPLVRELAQRRRETQHHRHVHPGTGRRRGARRSIPRCPPSCPCLPGASPTPAWTRCRTCANAKKILAGLPQAELLWASVREVLNIFQADDCGCEIVTVPHDILNKAMKLVGNRLAGNVARHRENVRRRRQGGGIFCMMTVTCRVSDSQSVPHQISIRHALSKTSSISRTPCTPAIPRACL